MLENLEPQPPDGLLALIKLHNADPRPDKIDLGVGVYRTADGATPVFASIKKAEQQLVSEQPSKAYLGPEGDMDFVAALMPWIFGTDDPSAGDRINGMQTPGGTGAVRLAVVLAKRAGVKRIHMGVPSWPNHGQILGDAGITVLEFNHAGADGGTDMDALRAALGAALPGDAVLLHGCCHNPTGIDYTAAQWDEIAALLAKTGVLPILDLAYHGLGAGLEEDAYGVRKVLASVPEALVAYSCDKNFGLYRDRVGALYVQTPDSKGTEVALANAHALARANWSMPPDHGAAAVRLVLADESFTKLWLEELDSMRCRIRQVREKLAASSNSGGIDLTPLARQHGMFAKLPLTKGQIQKLRADHGIYMAGSGRINVAGLTMANIDAFTSALAAVTG